jgi:hypothetical protein
MDVTDFITLNVMCYAIAVVDLDVVGSYTHTHVVESNMR